MLLLLLLLEQVYLSSLPVLVAAASAPERGDHCRHVTVSPGAKRATLAQPSNRPSPAAAHPGQPGSACTTANTYTTHGQ